MLAERIRLMESDIERIGGVQQARMRVEEGEISEVHVVADPSRRPKWIARDVITTLFARHGVRIPHQRISVAAAAPPGDTAVRGVPTAGSPRLVRVTFTFTGAKLQSTVEVAFGDRTATGTSEGPLLSGARERAAATATLDALRRLIGGSGEVVLEGLATVKVGSARAILVQVLRIDGRRIRSRLGCHRITRSSVEAASRATLRAATGLLRADLSAEDEPVEYLIEEREDSSG